MKNITSFRNLDADPLKLPIVMGLLHKTESELNEKEILLLQEFFNDSEIYINDELVTI